MRLARTRAAARRNLSDSRKRLHALFANAHDAILMIGEGRRFVDANPAAAALLGYSREELLSLTTPDIIAPGESARVLEARRRFALQGTCTGEYRLRRKDGTVVETEFRAVADILPGLHLAIGRDVTDRKRIEEELRRSRRLLEEAQEVAHIGGWDWDLDSDRLSWSAEMSRILGFSPQQRPSFAAALEALHPEDRARVRELNERAVRDGGHFAYDARIVRPDGEVRWMHARGHAERDAAGRVVRLMGIGQDITDRKRDEELRRRLIDRVISVHEEERSRISRELHDGPGQALTALLVGLRGLEDARTLAEVRLTAARQRELVAQTMDELSRLARGLRPTVLDDLGLTAALRRTAEQAGLSGFEVELAASSRGRLPRDVETAFYRVAQEALTNAARHSRARRVRISVERRRGVARLTVADDGCGFEVDRVLGSAVHLGLHGIRERAALLGGQAEIRSRLGRGTRIMVTVPLSPAVRVAKGRRETS